MSTTPGTPGTVSKILWHFTGGPEWNDVEKRQEDIPKDVEKAYQALTSIIKSKKIYLGAKKEILKGIAREIERIDPITGVVSRTVDEPFHILSAPVCCLADIPIPHLEYHASRYGKIAIGFRRESAIAHDFNPVLYALETSDRVFSYRQLHLGILTSAQIMVHHLTEILEELNAFLAHIKDIRMEADKAKPAKKKGLKEKVEQAIIQQKKIMTYYEPIHRLTQTSTQMQQGLTSAIAFIKTFKESEFNTIYCEREWRAVKEFNFSYGDISMIIVSKENDHWSRFHQDMKLFNKNKKPKSKNRFPETIPIVPWEDLIEH